MFVRLGNCSNAGGSSPENLLKDKSLVTHAREYRHTHELLLPASGPLLACAVAL